MPSTTEKAPKPATRTRKSKHTPIAQPAQPIEQPAQPAQPIEQPAQPAAPRPDPDAPDLRAPRRLAQVRAYLDLAKRGEPVPAALAESIARMVSIGRVTEKNARGYHELTPAGVAWLAEQEALAKGETPPAAIPTYEAERAAVLSWLDSLVWDGFPRLDIAALHLFGGDAIDRQRFYTFIVDAVKRVLTPGCAVGRPLAIVGPQGSGKSVLLRVLFGEQNVTQPPALDASELPHTWLHELSDPLRTDAQALALLHATADTVRVPYSRTRVTVPRWSTVAVTSNDAPRSDNFSVVHVREARADLAHAALMREQYFAEAVSIVRGAQ